MNTVHALMVLSCLLGTLARSNQTKYSDPKYIQKQDQAIIDGLTRQLNMMKVDNRSKEIKAYVANLTSFQNISQVGLQEVLFKIQILQSDIQQVWYQYSSYSTIQQLALQSHQHRLWLEVSKTASQLHLLELKLDKYWTPQFTCLSTIVSLLQEMQACDGSERSFASLLILRDQLQHRSVCYSQVVGYVDEDIEMMSLQEMERFELSENNYREQKGFTGWSATFQLIRDMDFRSSFREHQQIWQKSPKMMEALIVEYNKQIQKTVAHLQGIFEPLRLQSKAKYELHNDLLRQAEAHREMLSLQVQLSQTAIQNEIDLNAEIVAPYEDDWNGLEGIKATLLQYVDDKNLQIVTLGLQLLSFEYQDSLEKGDLQRINPKKQESLD